MGDQNYPFNRKVAVVTGASRGIGRAVTVKLAQRGCKVAVIARPSQALSETIASLQQQHFEVKAFPCDLNDRSAIAGLAEKLIFQYSNIDILVNCAGVGKFGPLANLTESEVVAPLDVPMTATILLTRHLLPAMINRNHSRIVNIITPAAYFDLPFMAAYTASRSGLLSFTRALDKELAQQGVRVRSVCPAWVDTDYLSNNQTDAHWYPKVSEYFPSVSAGQAAGYVIRAIEGNRRELIPLLRLKILQLGYRWFPGLSVATFKALGLYQPSALSSHQNREGSDSWTNWEESIALKPNKIVFPESVKQVTDIVTDKNRYPSPVRAAGSRHTTTHCGVADHGTLVIMRKLDKIIEIDREKLLVTAEAGALYIDVARALQKQGLQFYVNVEIGNLTMGSAASTGTKDASMPGEFGQVCSYCSAVKMVLENGQVREINENEPELMRAVRSSYGLLGVIVETTFRVKPIAAMQVRHQSYTLDEFEQLLPQLRQLPESIMYYLFPFQDRLTVEFRSYRQQAVKHYNHWLWSMRNLFWKTIAPRWGYLATRFVSNKTIRYRLIDGFYRVLDWLVCKILRSSATLATDQIIRYPEHKNISKYTFSIWAFPEQNIMPIMRAYFQFCKDYYRKHGFRCDMLNVGYRISSDQNPIFSYSYDGTVMTLDPVTTGTPGWDDFLRAYNEFCSSHNGVPLFNQSKWLNRNQVHKAFHQRITTFWHYKTQLDPENRFLNDYFRELFEPGHSGNDFKREI